MFNTNAAASNYQAQREAVQILRETKGRHGRVSAQALFDTIGRRHRVRGNWESCIPLTDGSAPFIRAVADNRERYEYECLEFAVGVRGVYVVIADWPADDISGDHANVTVSAAFIPEGAKTESDLLSLFKFRLTDQPVGDDLLASLYRGSPHTKAIQQVLENLLAENHRRARQIVRRHDFKTRSGEQPVAYTYVPDHLALLVAERPYPEKQLLIARDAEVENWIAEVPGRGILRIWALPQNLMDFLGDDGTYELYMSADLPDWIDETIAFRPTDSKRDPGLAERFTAALEEHQKPIPAGSAVEEEEFVF